MKALVHYHILLRAAVDNPTALDLEGLKDWMRRLVTEQGLEPVIGPNAVYVEDIGNEGPTGSVNIKTSHFAFHIWDNLGIMQADLYTCGELDVPLFLKAFDLFKPTTMQYLVLDRQAGFQILASSEYTRTLNKGVADELYIY